jgi:hypothetical protein
MTTDKFGRSWHYQSPWPYEKMLQIKPEMMKLFLDFSCRLGTGNYTAEYPGIEGNLDCYLLKDWLGWHVGVRFSDKDSDYLSPYLSDELVQHLIKCHCQVAFKGELAAVQKLVNAQMWRRERE